MMIPDPNDADAERRAWRFLAIALTAGGALTALTAIWIRDTHGAVLMAGTTACGIALWRIT